ncbi:hypothetical protein VP01_1744g1, partial [Puccinia sorghi]
EINLRKQGKKISIEYVFWNPKIQYKPPPTQSTYKKMAPLTPEDTKYIKLTSKKGKIDINWEIENLSFSKFKRYVFQSIQNQDAPELGDNTEQLINNGMITWEVSVPHNVMYTEK